MTLRIWKPEDSPSPGVYLDVPDAEYRAWPYPSQTYLGKVCRGYAPATVNYERHHDDGGAARIVGRAFHDLLLLGEAYFQRRWTTTTNGRKSNAFRGSQVELRELGLELLEDEEAKDVVRWVAATKQHPSARRLLELEGHNEVSFVHDLDAARWSETLLMEERAVVTCKGRVDRLCHGGATIVDVKTTLDARASKFRWTMRDFGYTHQAVLYSLMVEAQLGLEVEAYAVVAVEKNPPYLVQVFDIEIDDDVRQQTLAELREAALIWQECTESGVWPGYPSTPVVLHPPGSRR